MKKNVDIKIRGLQGSLSDDPLGEEVVELITNGEIYEKHGDQYVVYDDFNLDEENPVKTTVKIHEGKVDIKRFGTAKHHMTFDADKKHQSHYETPYGILDILVQTESIEVEKTDKALKMTIRYKLSINEGPLGDAFFEMLCTYR